jgi:hypothetical protein
LLSHTDAGTLVICSDIRRAGREESPERRSLTHRLSAPGRPAAGRLLNDFRNLGFNQAENGKIVFDGMMQWIAAGNGINMNLRFSEPGRTERNWQDQL